MSSQNKASPSSLKSLSMTSNSLFTICDINKKVRASGKIVYLKRNLHTADLFHSHYKMSKKSLKKYHFL